MSDVINGVPRKLLEFIAANARGVERERMGELRALLATPPADAADMGGQAREEVEVMAYAVDHPEAGYKVYKQFSQWMNGGEWRCDSLMTVAQHQRITVAMAAEVETWRSNALMLEQANAGLAQLNGKLRAELAASTGQEKE